VSVRVAQARVLVAEGEALAAVARVMQISRQAVYRRPRPRRSPQRRPVTDPVELAIVETARSYPTDGYRMICCFVRRALGVPVNRKRVLRVMREQKLIERRPVEARRRRPGVFKVERPGQLWHLDMTSIWVAEHGWCYLNAIIDCCTREIVGWSLELRCRAAEATAVIKQAVDEQQILPGTLTLGTDNGSAFTARVTRLAISALGVTHRRGGYRDPESQAFIESWFRYLKERCVWRNELETLDQAREVIAAYIDHYHDRPHSRLDYRTPHEVRATWDDAQQALHKTAA
jgi:putative transposase